MEVLRRRALSAAAAFVIAAAPAAAANEVYCPNPGIDCHKVLVVPIKYVQPWCPDASAACPPFINLIADPPRIDAWQLLDVLNQRVNPHMDDWSFGDWQFQFDLLANPDSADGWWPTPVSIQDYYLGHLAGCDLWNCVPGYRAIVEDAIRTIASQAAKDGLIDSPATYSRMLVVDNQHERGGQATEVIYSVPVFVPGNGWNSLPHLFTGTWAAVGLNDDAFVQLVSHELMHQLGPTDYYGACFIAEAPAPFTDECNGVWDVMAYDFQGPAHPTGYNKLGLGWVPLDSLRVKTLPVPGAAYSTSIDLHPLEERDAANARLIRIPFTQAPAGAPFEGYHLECRQHIRGDDVLPQTGLLIQLVREAAPGVAQNGPMAARVIHADESFSLNEAPLQPGGTWVDAQRGVQIDFTSFVGPAANAACRVNITYAAAGAKPDPMFVTIQMASPDLWLDSPDNGAGVYPASQPLDGDGAPTGPGDPFSPGKGSILRFRVRNSGTAASPPIAVRLTAEQPPYLACGASPPKILDTIRFIAPIPAGGVALDSVGMEIPADPIFRGRATILPVAGELSPSNNVAERIFSAGSGSSVIDDGVATPVTINTKMVNGCPIDQLVSSLAISMPLKPGPPIPDPIFDRWRLVSPGLTLVGAGETLDLPLTFTPPNPITPGGGATIPIAVRSGALSAAGVARQAEGGLFGEGRPAVDAFSVSIPVVDRATLSESVSAGPLAANAPMSVSGTLSPTSTVSPIGLNFTSPEGDLYPVPVDTDSRGNYFLGLMAPWPGPWKVEARWPGDETRSEARSPVNSFVVVPDLACGVSAQCDDGNPCTSDTCNRATGRCQYAFLPDGSFCDDGDRCTAGVACAAGACGQRVVCNDYDVCTFDACDPVSGSCRYDPYASSEVPDLGFAAQTILQWGPTPGASYWNSYRGTIPRTLLAGRGGTYDEGCFESGDTAGDGPLMSADPALPPPETAFYYLVSEKTLCMEGPAGQTAAGLPRPPAHPCPPF